MSTMSAMDKREARFEASKTADNPSGVYIDPREDGTARTGTPSSAKSSGKDRSKQPDIINLRTLDTSTAQEVETDVLRPVVFSSDNTFCRFELEPKGFLSPTSSISIGVKAPAGMLKAQFPINIGVHSLIQRAVLKTSSGRVICDMDEFGWFSSYKSAFVDGTSQQERDQYTSGRVVNWGSLYTDPTESTTPFETNTQAKYLGLQNGKEYGGIRTDLATVDGLTPRNFTITSADAQRSGLNPTFAIRLYDLFPFLKSGNQIPLFMMGSDRIQVELTFTDPASTDRMVLSKEDEGRTGARFDIDQNTVEFISDHIFYPQQMEKWASMNKDLTFQYFDYVSSRQTVTASDTAVDDNTQVNVRNIGGAGRIVTRCIAGYRPSVVTLPTHGGINDLAIFNKYQARGMRKTGADVGQLKSNLRYNEKQLYPLEVNNGARHYHNLRDAEMKQLYVPRQLYTGGGSVLPNAGAGNVWHYNGRTQDQLEMSQFYQAWRINSGERIGTKGIEIEMSANNFAGDKTGLDPGTYTQTCFTEQLRYATLKDGHMEVFFS